MDLIELAPDFREFLSLLNSHQAEYLLVGGYAVGFHGYTRATNDMDIWVGVSSENADKMVDVFRDFGFSPSSIHREAFLDSRRIIRMGIAPVCIDVIMSVSGLDFATCFANRMDVDYLGTSISVLNIEDLKTNKRASGRAKDINDLEQLS